MPERTIQMIKGTTPDFHIEVDTDTWHGYSMNDSEYESVLCVVSQLLDMKETRFV